MPAYFWAFAFGQCVTQRRYSRMESLPEAASVLAPDYRALPVTDRCVKQDCRIVELDPELRGDSNSSVSLFDRPDPSFKTDTVSKLA